MKTVVETEAENYLAQHQVERKAKQLLLHAVDGHTIRKYGSTFYIGPGLLWSFSIKPVQIEISIFTFIFHLI